MKFNGTAHRYGRDIDTDVIIPARYLNTSVPEELAKHCMEDLDPKFVEKVDLGDILVAEENFGCGSSREHAPISIKAAGVSVVIAKSFARIHRQNLINFGVVPLIFDDPDDYDRLETGAELKLEGLEAAVADQERIDATLGDKTISCRIDLSPRERKILDWRFGLDNGGTETVTLGEIGKRLGISRERVRQIECAALARLRRAPSVRRLRGGMSAPARTGERRR